MIKQLAAQSIGTMICTMKEIHVDTWIALVCVISLLVIAILPVSIGRSETEIYLCFIIPAEAIIGFLSLLIQKTRIRFAWIDGIVLGWYAYSMGRFWLDATFPAAGFAIRASLMCMLYIGMRFLLTGCRIDGSTIAALFILFAVIEAGMGYYQIFSGASRHHLYPVTGSFLNPGPYSAFLVLGIVGVCALRKQYQFNYILIVLLSVPLILTMSRTAFLAIFVCLLIRYRKRIKGWRKWGLLLAVTSICALCLYFLKAGSADGRGIINYIGLRCFADNPLWGNGIGSFFNRYALKTAEISMQSRDHSLLSVDAIDYAFDDLLHVGVEQGAIGLAFSILLIATVMLRLWKGCRQLFLAGLVLLIFSLFSYPFELLPYQIIGVIITSYAATNSKMDTATSHTSFSLSLLMNIVVLPAICMVSYRCGYSVRERLNAEREYRMIAGLRDSAFIKDYYSLLPYLQDNKHFLFDFAKILSEQRRYNDSNDMLRRGALISNDPMFLVLQGNNYRDIGAYELAEKTYLQAWHTMPNRIYPLYRLMKLYEKRGDTVKAIEYAKKVIEFKEKISSPAVDDIKKEALERINISTNLK